jgi:hypothetical protein
MCEQQASIVYRIRVEGRLDADWSGWLNGLSITVETGPAGQVITCLTGPVADQAALRGIVCRLWDVNLALVSVERVPAVWQGRLDSSDVPGRREV